jgi:hypothetical protein
MSIEAFEYDVPGPVAFKSSKDKTYEENMKYLSSYEWAITETVHDMLKLSRDFDRENVACNIADAYRDEIKDSWEKKEDYKVVAERVYKKYYEANKDELDYYPQRVENPKVGDLVMAINGIPKTDEVYALGKIVRISHTVTFGEVYWLEGSYSYFTSIIKPNAQYKHLNTKDWDDLFSLVSKYIDEEFEKGFTYKTMDREKLNAKTDEIYETLRNKENN